MTRPLEVVGDLFEHSRDLREAHRDIADLRKRIKRLLWVSSGRGYDGMGLRELEQARAKIDEASFWLGAAGGSLNAGGKRAIAEGYEPRPPREKQDVALDTADCPQSAPSTESDPHAPDGGGV